MALIVANLDYVSGHLRTGHKELEMKDDELEMFKKLSKSDQIKYFEGLDSEFELDDFEVNDYGDINDIIIEE